MKIVPIFLALVFSFSFNTYAFNYANDDKSIFIVGSTSLAKVLSLTVEPFYKSTGITVIIRPIGSDKGVVSIAEDVSDIGIISRFMTEAESNKWPELRQIVVGQDIITFIVNKKNPLNNITTEQAQDIYTGKITHWSTIYKLSGNDNFHWNKMNDEITLFSKGKQHGTHSSFLDYFQLTSTSDVNNTHALVFKKEGMNNLYGKVPATEFNQINQAIGNISRIPSAIAYESLGAFDIFQDNYEVNGVKILALDGVFPLSEGNINENYPFKRPLNIVINKTASANVKKYINFLKSERGQQILSERLYLKLASKNNQ